MVMFPGSRRHPPRWQTLALSALAHAGYLVSLTVLVVIGVPALLPLTVFPSWRRRVCRGLLRRFLIFFTRVYLPALRVYRVVEISGLDPLAPPRGMVCVANHRSALDGLLLLPLVHPAAMVLKSKHARKPGYAGLVWLFDFIAMGATSLDGLRRAVDQCRRLLDEGVNLVVFPEGSRSSSTRLLPFADFAFRLAAERRVPILPVVVHSDRPFLNRQKGSYFPRDIIEFRIRFLPPVFPSAEDDAATLATRVRRFMATVLADLDRAFLKPAWDK